jgi:hypothetical protein
MANEKEEDFFEHHQLKTPDMDIRSITAFEAKWGENGISPHQLLMILDASEAVLKTKFPGKRLTPSLIIEFSKVVCQQLNSPASRTEHE